jgi:flavin reductase (DIM6/NTAB) family NADH-FMN oxidoreductase RutF
MKDKTSLEPTGAHAFLFPMPTVLVGTEVEGKANYMTAAWCTPACAAPPMIAVAINHIRHTALGIDENRAFSINVPTVRQVIETDYCGIASGAKVDKTKVFTSFYGTFKAPMARECPINIECSLHTSVDLGSHELYIGQVESVFVDKTCSTEFGPDPVRTEPIVYLKSKYYHLGHFLADAFSEGKKHAEK